jgi:hypothetical protein
MILMDLFQIQAVGERYIIGQPKLGLEGFINDVCFLLCTVVSYSHISGSIDNELICVLLVLQRR